MTRPDFGPGDYDHVLKTIMKWVTVR